MSDADNDRHAESASQVDFAQLVTARKDWLQQVLRPWCQQARRSDLLLAEQEWLDIAGKVDPQKTLWAWAWSRFPVLVHEELGIDETSPVTVKLAEGQEFTGYPDARTSLQGRLVLVGTSESGALTDWGPFSIDEIVAIDPGQ